MRGYNERPLTTTISVPPWATNRAGRNGPAGGATVIGGTVIGGTGVSGTTGAGLSCFGSGPVVATCKGSLLTGGGSSAAVFRRLGQARYTPPASRWATTRAPMTR